MRKYLFIDEIVGALNMVGLSTNPTSMRDARAYSRKEGTGWALPIARGIELSPSCHVFEFDDVIQAMINKGVAHMTKITREDAVYGITKYLEDNPNDSRDLVINNTV